MRKILTVLSLSAALVAAPAVAHAQSTERFIDGAIGAMVGALVAGPIGLVAGAAIGMTAGPGIGKNLGVASKPRVRHARRARRVQVVAQQDQQYQQQAYQQQAMIYGQPQAQVANQPMYLANPNMMTAQTQQAQRPAVYGYVPSPVAVGGTSANGGYAPQAYQQPAAAPTYGSVPAPSATNGIAQAQGQPRVANSAETNAVLARYAPSPAAAYAAPVQQANGDAGRWR